MAPQLFWTDDKRRRYADLTVLLSQLNKCRGDHNDSQMNFRRDAEEGRRQNFFAGVAHILTGNYDTVAVSFRERNLIIMYENGIDDMGDPSPTTESIKLIQQASAPFDSNTSQTRLEELLKEYCKHSSGTEAFPVHAANLRGLIDLCHVTGEQYKPICHGRSFLTRR